MKHREGWAVSQWGYGGGGCSTMEGAAAHLAHGVRYAKRGRKEEIGEAHSHDLLEGIAQVRPNGATSEAGRVRRRRGKGEGEPNLAISYFVMP